MTRVSMRQMFVVMLFVCAATTILYSQQTRLTKRFLTAVPVPCESQEKVNKAVKNVKDARQSILENNFPPSNSYPFNKKQIILLTYGRSGSSFTANLLIQDPRTFFAFEPLIQVIKRYNDGISLLRSFDALSRNTFAPKRNKKGKLVNPDPDAILGIPTYPNLSVEVTQIARYFLTCQFEHLKMDDLLTPLFSWRQNTIEFHKCIRDFPKSKDHFPRYLGCIWRLKQLCLSKDFTVIKFIRYPAKLLWPLMEEFPNLKVIYLVRDPRGTLASAMSLFGIYQHMPVRNASEMFCKLVNEDVQAIRSLSEAYPDRIRTIRYETIARDTVAAARKMYKFLNLSFTPTIERYVRNITANEKDGHDFAVFRKDSWLAANKWRSRSIYENVLTIDSACSDVYDSVGFVKVSRESDLRDLSMSLVAKKSDMDRWP